jgi:outer membrane protein OmpA-like peptidoglycan-associated protein
MMRKLYLFLFLTICFQIVQAQTPKDKNAVIFRTLWTDYVNPNEGDLLDYKNYRYGFSAAYGRNIIDWLNLEVPIQVANPLLKGDPRNKFMFGLDIQAHAQYYKETNPVIPYFVIGAGAKIIDTLGLHPEFPIGLGVDIRLFERGYLNFQAEYRYSTKADRKSINLGVGLKYLLGREVKDMDKDGVVDTLDECPNIAGLATLKGCPDKDNDGIADHLDQCPDVAGPKSTMGCPDRDKDGIPDKDDKCPDQAGPVSNGGCPILDRDGDGINDDIDKCPDEAGTMATGGCPDRDEDGVADKYDECPDVVGLKEFNGCPDTDGDGIEDRLDKCPETPGVKSNNGCPEIEVKDKEKLEFAMQQVQFEVNKATLLPVSYSILDEIAGIMKKYPDYNLDISGHTDPTGNRNTNIKLSLERAKTCFNYLVSRGISTGRMTYEGYGPDKPRYDNKTSTGRKLNRRVEFNMNLK